MAMPKDTLSPIHLQIAVGQHSRAGTKASNQDGHGAAIPTGRALRLKGMALAVADGISSSPVSGEAARLAVDSLLTDYYCTSDAWAVKTAASRVIAAINAWLYSQNRQARVEDMDHGRVCTLAALILKGVSAHLFHVGDSRIWRFTAAGLEPLTEDHRAILSAHESSLSRALGAEAQVKIDHRRVAVSPGDIFLLSTDGLHDHLTTRQVARALDEAPDLNDAAARLCADAQAAGSTDDCTLQIVRVLALPEDDPDLLDGADALPVPPLPKAGDVIDGYRVVRPLHANHRSHIFLASAPDGSQVALKIPATDMREDPVHLRRFLMEEWIARRITSAHVLQAATPPTPRTALYGVTVYVDGQTLRQWMTDHPHPTLDQLRDIIGQLIRGLRAFHRSDMLHQDLRPENVMIDRDGTVKIIDLGSVYVAGVEEARMEPSQDILGTLQYTAPEYFSGEPVSWRSDLFSVGVIAYELLTGRLPYGTQVARVRSRIDQQRLMYRAARDDRTGLPLWVDDALRCAVHPDPNRRFDALSEFDAALRKPSDHPTTARHVPLIERNPLMFWKCLSALLAVLLLVQLARGGP